MRVTGWLRRKSVYISFDDFITEKTLVLGISHVKAITQSAYTFVEYLEYWHEHFFA